MQYKRKQNGKNMPESKEALPQEDVALPAAQAGSDDAGGAENAAVHGRGSSAETGGIPAQAGAENAAADTEGAENAAAGSGTETADGAEKVPAQFDENKLSKQRRRNKWGFLISLVIIGCVVYALWTLNNTISQGDSATFYEVVANMNWWYIALAFGLFFVMFVMEALKFTLLCRCNGCSMGFAKDMKLALIGKYYECITPLSSGGQPMQIYYLYKNGVPTAKGASIAMVKYGVHMLGFTVVAAVVMGLGVPWLGKLIENEATLNVVVICGWIGFGINAFIPVFVTLVVFLPKQAAWLVNLCVKILHKIRIIRHPEKWEAKVRKWFDDFAVFSQFVYKNPLAFIALFLLCLGEPIIELIIPYYVLIAMCGQYVEAGGALFWTVVSLAMYATYAAVFIPTPGNSGAVESVFMLAFAALTDNVLFWFVLVWRFILYYTYIIAGVGMNVTDMVGRIRKNRRERLSRRQ